jgi:hypothetical protein
VSGGGFDVRVQGIEKMAQLGKDLRAAGAKDLRKELLKAGRDAGKQAQAVVREHALSDLPVGGDLNQWVAARTKVTAQTKLAGKNVGLRLRMRHKSAKGLSDLPAINDGRLRHPVFGHSVWVLQSIAPGFAWRAVDEIGDVLADEFLAAVDRVADKLAAGG